MGQKTHPLGFRLGVIKSWNSKWFAGKDFSSFIYEDLMVKRYINARLENAGLAKVEILRAPKKVTVDIHTSRPGIVIGRKGAEVDKLREELQLLTSKDISLNIIEVKKPELNARLVADSVARQLEGRVSYRRAMKKAIAATMIMGAEGVKIICKGRLAGAEIARTEKYMDGRVPLHTLRADIDYATSTAHTTYGCIGVKVWICRQMVMGAGELAVKDEIDKSMTERPEIEMPTRKDRRRREDKGRKRRPRGRVRRPAGRAPDGRGGERRDSAGKASEPGASPARKPDSRPPRKPDSRPARKPDSRPPRKSDSRPARKPDSRPPGKPDSKPARKPDSRPARKPDKPKADAGSGKPKAKKESAPSEKKSE
ncbi:MAG: 30S ribosomal protein S3 [Candidatus Zixiibacteriota bacterium]|nr:MAG: 30S ribosomal protein S3 [candidate division Zixibacteria bacterium]